MKRPDKRERERRKVAERADARYPTAPAEMANRKGRRRDLQKGFVSITAGEGDPSAPTFSGRATVDQLARFGDNWRRQGTRARGGQAATDRQTRIESAGVSASVERQRYSVKVQK